MSEKETILITGSSGFIGSALAENLKNKYHVIGVDRDFPKHKIPDVSYYRMNIVSKEDISHTLKQIKAEHGNALQSVVHLVAYYSFTGEEDEKYQKITVDGTHDLLNQLKNEFTVEQFIFCSTLLVYEPVQPGKKIRDDSPLHPSWPYPKSKVQTEQMIKHIREDIPVVNLRLAGIYNDFCHSPTISNQIMRIYEGQATSFLFPGNADHGQSFLHLDDLVEAIERFIIKRKNISGMENFVLGEESVMSFRDVQRVTGEHLYQRPWPTIRVPKFVARTGAHVMQHLPFIREPFIMPWMISHADEHMDVDITRIKSLLGWQPKRSLAEKLPVMIENLKKDPAKWYAINKIEKPFYRNLDQVGSESEKNQWIATISVVFLGILLISNPFNFGEIGPGEFSSQLISGILVTIVGALSIFPTLRWLRWVNTLIGSWLLFSPLIFEESAAAYSNDTLIGALIMLASTFTPSTSSEKSGKGAPPGWSYNPSTAGQRLPIMFLAFIGFILSRYLAAFQLGHIETIWDPFFGSGTEMVLTSSVSKAFPISDAGLGALTYLLDVVAAAIGGKQRWKTMPWAVILFGFMIIPAGVTSIVLVMLQPISVGAWCTICLATAFVMLIMVPPAVDEVLASVQFLIRCKKQNKSFWKVFWLGSTEEEPESRISKIHPQGSLIHLYLSVILGIWLMFTPAIFDIEGMAANNIYVISSLITTFAIISLSEVARIVRLINVPLAAWLILSAWTVGSIEEIPRWHSVLVGVILVVLSLPRGKMAQRFGSLDRLIHWTPIRL